MKVRHGSDRGRRWGSTLDAGVDREQMLCWQMIFPLDQDRLAALGLNSRTGILPSVSPHARGRKLRMQPLLKLGHANSIKGALARDALRLHGLWDRQGIDESIHRSRLTEGSRSSLLPNATFCA